MKFVDGVILFIIVAVIAGVVKVMKKQKERGSGCHSGCGGCSKANRCSKEGGHTFS